MFSKISAGTRKESSVTDKTMALNTAAMTTYQGISSSIRSLVSSTMADILDRKHCSPASARISSTASSVSSAEVVVSIKMNIRVPSPSSE